MTRRDEVTDAAITTTARDGLRGLTHRAVDRTAGLPEGSSSYYFRTRQALLQAMVTRMAVLDSTQLAPLDLRPARIDVPAFAAFLAEQVELATTTHRDRMLARYELSLEATRRPELRAALVEVGERYRALATALLTAAGAPDPPRQGRALVAYVDGLIYDRIAGVGARSLTPEEIHRSLGETVAGMLDHPSGS